ncbi:hypothetical protein DdX_14940 [Ditylenchus destructor]|uniref:Uncharacterized protein n=1 Tax=Ditylenchus destructor TaxID=166010 RepID=A0AAD4R1I1_9BILA|nr:hypothetical protein DdX_14940 [Ditylenchus destructor]
MSEQIQVIDTLFCQWVRDSSSPGQFITRDNSSPATIHHLRQFITCDNSSPGQFITCDNSSPATIHHP